MEYMGTLFVGQRQRHRTRGGDTTVHQKDADDISLQQRLAVVLAGESVVRGSERARDHGWCSVLLGSYVCSHIDLVHQASQHTTKLMQCGIGAGQGGHITYTMESRVAAMDATPATMVAAASNFWPVPPVMVVGDAEA